MMWKDISATKIIRRQVRDERGRLIGKIFRIEQIVCEGQNWKVATVIDEQTMLKCTLKMMVKSENICKSQIVKQIKNQKKMSGRFNFIELKAVYEDANMIYLLMGLWGTPLQDVLARRYTLMQREVQLIFCQLVDILQNLRSANISHGNITLASVLFAPNKQNIIQLTDFTHSHDVCSEDNSSDKISNKGTGRQSRAKWALDQAISNDSIQQDNLLRSANKQINEYTSPQEYYDDRNSSKFSYQRDIWACGVLLYKLLTGMYPFTGEGGKIILNKIKNATFSFPTFQEVRFSLQQQIQSQLKSKKGIQFLSSEWKQLLKRMLSVKNQRITLKQLINHPFKASFFSLKNIPNLQNSNPDLSLLFPLKPKASTNLFKKSWNINYQDQKSDQEGIDIGQNTLLNLGVIVPKILNHQNTQSLQKLNNNQNGRDSNVDSNIGDNTYAQHKRFRFHKTQFGSDSSKSIQNQRHETLGGVKQRIRRQKQTSLITPVSECTQHAGIPSIVKQPTFIMKFKQFKKIKYLGYILNNSVGVIFEDGQHIIGHTKNQYRYIEQPSQSDSQILIDNTQCVNNYSKTAKQSIYKNQSKNSSNQRNTKDQSVKLTNKAKTNFMSEQVSVKTLDQNLIAKYTTSNSIDNKYYKSQFLSRDKLNIYWKALQHFGERVVKGALDIWIQRYWRDGNVFIFLLNTGCWQVAFCQAKGFRIYAIDTYELSWSKDEASYDVLHCVREIVAKYKLLAKIQQPI